MRLWSFQSEAVVKRLRSGSRHEVPWARIWSGDRDRYMAMVQTMRDRGIPVKDAPVWAWEGEPTDALVWISDIRSSGPCTPTVICGC